MSLTLTRDHARTQMSGKDAVQDGDIVEFMVEWWERICGHECIYQI